MDFTHEDGDTVANSLKPKKFDAFINKAQKINSSYFTTNKDFRLGDELVKAFQQYGTPTGHSSSNGIDKYEWDFMGDLLYDGKTPLNGKPLAKNNYGHQVIMFFKGTKLVAIILHNDIP